LSFQVCDTVSPHLASFDFILRSMIHAPGYWLDAIALAKEHQGVPLAVGETVPPSDDRGMKRS